MVYSPVKHSCGYMINSVFTTGTNTYDVTFVQGKAEVVWVCTGHSTAQTSCKSNHRGMAASVPGGHLVCLLTVK